MGRQADAGHQPRHPEELVAAIRAAHDTPPWGSPALAPAEDYAARVETFKDFEAAAGAAWMRARAEMDVEIVFPELTVWHQGEQQAQERQTAAEKAAREEWEHELRDGPPDITA